MIENDIPPETMNEIMDLITTGCANYEGKRIVAEDPCAVIVIIPQPNKDGKCSMTCRFSHSSYTRRGRIRDCAYDWSVGEKPGKGCPVYKRKE